MSTLLTKRRAVDLCRVAACLCCPSWRRAIACFSFPDPPVLRPRVRCGRPGDRRPAV